MRKIIFAIFVTMFIFLFLGKGAAGKDRPAIKIGRITVSAGEFDKAFKSSSFFREGKSSRKEFLDSFISRKLILREAEREGLNKDSEFLEDIQLFWEQSLLKLAISKKMNELSCSIKVNDKEIEDYYNEHKDRDFSNKKLNDVYGRIKLILFKKKQGKALQDWVNSLRENTKIKIDYKSLGIY